MAHTAAPGLRRARIGFRQTMARTERHYGSIPSTRRRLVIVLCLLLGIAVIVGGLMINWFSDTPVKWAWLMVAAGFAVGFGALYLWIRLSD